LATLSAEKRTKEIGIRKVLGASIASIVTLLSTDFIKLVCLSFIFSFPLAYFSTQKWLEKYPYRADFNWWIFAFTALITICIALFTVGWQSIRAALMNPVKSLKTE
jgi:ABC-type antimicrobial peptide transport system permease subunit